MQPANFRHQRQTYAEKILFKTIFSLVLLIAGANAQAQNADPYISMQAIPGSIPLNSNATVEIMAGNVGNGSMVSNSMRIIVSVGINAEIIGLGAGSDPRWAITGFDFNGSGNTVYLINTGTTYFSSFDVTKIYLTVTGTVIDGPSSITGNIGYVSGPNPLLGGASNASQGNASWLNDNSVTSLTVTGNSPEPADPYISIQANPGSTTVNTNAIVEVVAGNTGNGNIVSNSMCITITAGNNAEITGIGSGSDSRWTIEGFNYNGTGNTLKLINTGLAQFNSFDINQINVILKSTAVGGPAAITGSISYINASNPILNGAPNASQGNMKVENDNSITSLTVTPNLCLQPATHNIYGSQTLCSVMGTSTYFVTPVAGATSYIWSVSSAGMSIISGQGTSSVNVSYNSSFSSGTLCVRPVFGTCEGATKCLTIHKNKPAMPGPISGAAFGVCISKKTYSIPSVSGATQYLWVVPSGSNIVSGQGTTSIVVNFANNFNKGDIKVVAINTCGSSNWSKPLAIIAKPKVPESIIGDEDPCKGSTGPYTTLAQQGATFYNWQVSGTGYSITNGNNTYAISVKIGAVNGSVKVRAGNSCGTSDWSENFQIKPVACAGNAPLSLVPVDNTFSLKVSPNPSSSEFNVIVNSNFNKIITVRLMNMNGVVMSEKVVKASSIKVGSDLMPGIYMLEVSDGAARTVKKIVKL